jgi:uncharacterized protein YfdQ (DUF2303 family)
MAEIQQENIAATVAREARKPFAIPAETAFIALPDGWRLQDTEEIDEAPRRKKAAVKMDDDAGYIDYLKRHGSVDTTTIWCNADYEKGLIDYTGVLNDHAGAEVGQEWRDHIASFTPEKSVEWKRWIGKNTGPMDQVEFATFIEDNLADIATAEGFPTGTDMLHMSTNLEITQDSSIKSAIRTQSGGVRISYVEDANAETAKFMDVFSQFAIGIPVFRGGEAYQVNARLKYRLNGGKLKFWYELIRADKVMEASARTLTEKILAQTGFPIFHGNPFAK